MSDDIWDTKYGRRKVRHDPPTVEEAVVAAQGLTDDLKEQIEIVASLMALSPEEARGSVLRMGQRKAVNRVPSPAALARLAPWWSNAAPPAASAIPRRLVGGGLRSGQA